MNEKKTSKSKLINKAGVQKMVHNSWYVEIAGGGGASHSEVLCNIATSANGALGKLSTFITGKVKGKMRLLWKGGGYVSCYFESI